MPMLSIAHGQWFILGFLFFGLSFLMPKRIPFILAACSFFCGFLVWILSKTSELPPLGLMPQLLIFILGILLGLYFTSPPLDRPHSGAPVGPHPHPGTTFFLSSPIESGKGQIILHNKVWHLVGEDQPVHAQVIVLSIKGNTLYVKRLGDHSK